eukprot:gene15030-20226_t
MDISHTSSSGSQQHYVSLLNTVSELRLDLEKTLQKIKALEETNLQLSNNYNAIKDELVETRKKYNEVKENYLSSVQEKINLERQYEDFSENLKAKLRLKSDEFDAYKDQFIPHDIDQLRIKIQEECEVLHKSELLLLEQQIENEKNQYYICKREFEKFKSENEIIFYNQLQEIQSLQKQNNSLEEELRNQIIKSSQIQLDYDNNHHHNNNNSSFLSTGNINNIEKIRLLKQKNNEYEHIINNLTNELKETKQKQNDLLYKLETDQVTHENIILEWKSKIIQNETEKIAINERMNSLRNDYNKKEIILHQNKELIEELQTIQEELKKNNIDLEKNISIIKLDFQKIIENMKNNHENELNELSNEMSEKQQKIINYEDIIRKLQLDCMDLQSRFESNELEIRKKHTNQLHNHFKKISLLEIENNEYKNNLKMNEMNYQQIILSNQIEIDNLKSDNSRLKREKEIIYIKNREIELMNENNKNILKSNKHDILLLQTTYESKIKEYKSILQNVENNISFYKQKEVEIMNENKILIESKNNNEKKNNELVHFIEELRREFHKQMNEKIESINKQSKKLIQKEKKRGDAYKEKALQAHSREKSLSIAVGNSNKGIDYQQESSEEGF